MDALVDVEGHELRLTNLDKVLYPKVGFTKADVIDYYRRIAPVLLPHMKGRAITLKRYPDGVEGGHFYEKTCPSYRPEWVRTAPVWSKTRGAPIDFCLLDDLPSLLWAANLADLEIHAYLAKAAEPEIPTSMVFDLDPGEGADILDCCDVALLLRDELAALSLESFPKTSGSKGLQLYVPLNAPCTFDDTKRLAHGLGEVLEREHPQRVVTSMTKALRKGKVLIDWSQNHAHKTTVCAYSLRAKEAPTVSTPVTWEEVEEATGRSDASLLRFLPEQVFARVDEFGDLFEPVLTMEQSLPVLTS